MRWFEIGRMVVRQRRLTTLCIYNLEVLGRIFKHGQVPGVQMGEFQRPSRRLIVESGSALLSIRTVPLLHFLSKVCILARRAKFLGVNAKSLKRRKPVSSES